MPTAHGTPVIGLTGAVAAGKSAALAALAKLGAATHSSDAIVHEVLSTDHARDLLVEQWGDEVAPDGEIDRAKVAAIVFSDPEQLAWLERTLHPIVGIRTAEWLTALPADTRIAVLEVPLLFETEMEGRFDATIAVIADEAIRVERAGARGTADLKARAGRQLPQEEKASRATYVVRNDGSLEDLENELATILPDIEASAGERG